MSGNKRQSKYIAAFALLLTGFFKRSVTGHPNRLWSADKRTASLYPILRGVLLIIMTLLGPSEPVFAQTPTVGLATPASIDIAWRARAPMPTTRSFLNLIQADNGKIYAIGGYGVRSPRLNTVEEFEPATNTWSTKAPMPTPRAAAAAVVQNGMIYVIGGGNAGGNVLAAVEEYNPTTNTWTRRASMPTAREDVAAAVGNDGKIYVIGGNAGGCSPSSTVEAYDPVTDVWTTKAPMPTARWGMGVKSFNGKIYAIGGRTEGCYSYILTAANEEYDPATNSWRTLESLPFAREHSGVAVSHGLIYSVGGISAPSFLGNVDAYDPVMNSWSTATPLLTPRYSIGVTATSDGKILAIGGVTAGYLLSNVNEEGTLNLVSYCEGRVSAKVTTSGFIYSRSTKTYHSTVTVKNTGSTYVNGPLSVVFANLPTGVTLLNASGTSLGSPYAVIPSLSAAPDVFAPNQSVSFPVQFNATVPINFSNTVCSGSLVP